MVISCRQQGGGQTLSFLCNLFIFIVTAFFTFGFFRKDGAWDLARGKNAFRYFTVQSNVLCAFSALFMCVFPEQYGIWLLKYVGTAAVTVTLATVFLFLGPTMGYKNLLKGSDFFMHLATPLVAIASFCFPEKRGMTFQEAMLGTLPVILYGAYYAYKILKAPPEKAWEDFYGFNRGGKWPIAMAAMFVGTVAVCILLMVLQNA